MKLDWESPGPGALAGRVAAPVGWPRGSPGHGHLPERTQDHGCRWRSVCSLREGPGGPGPGPVSPSSSSSLFFWFCFSYSKKLGNVERKAQTVPSVLAKSPSALNLFMDRACLHIPPHHPHGPNSCLWMNSKTCRRGWVPLSGIHSHGLD